MGSYGQIPGGHKEENDFLKFTMSEIIPPGRQPMTEQRNSTMVARKQRLGNLKDSEQDIAAKDILGRPPSSIGPPFIVLHLPMMQSS